MFATVQTRIYHIGLLVVVTLALWLASPAGQLLLGGACDSGCVTGS